VRWSLALTTVLSAAGSDGRADWLASGPYGGAAQIVRVAPKQVNMVLAASGNGLLYQSLDGGRSWAHRPFPAQLAGTLHSLEGDPRSPLVWYAGVESEDVALAGVYKTEDGGSIWKALPGLTGKSVWALAIWSAQPDVIAAGTSSGVFLSSDAGANWSRISPESNPELQPVVALAFHPTDRNTIYAGTTHLPWRTRDGGAHWESIHVGMIDDSDIFSIVVEPRSPSTMFASACSGVYRSGDAGNSWKRLATPKGAYRAHLVTLDPRRSGVVFAATSAGLLRSADSGATWKRISHHAVKSIAFDWASPGQIYFASTTGGLLVSRDAGNTLLESNTGFSNRNFAAIAGSGGALYVNTVYEPGDGGIFRTVDRGLSWRRMSRPGANENIVLLAASPDDPDRLYAAGYRSLFRSTDGATTWIRQAAPRGDGTITALLPLSRGTLLAGTSAGLFRYAAASWAKVELPGLRGRVERLQSSGDGRIAALTTEGVFKSEDSGSSWAPCGQPPVDAVWYGVTLDSRGGLAATSRGLLRSTDRCASWSPVRGGLDQATVSAVLFHPQHAGEAFAAQFGLIFRTTDGGLTWRPLGDKGRNGAYPSALLMLAAAPQRLFALFPRRGVLSIPVDLDQGNQPIGEN
jgi:photosystem II stability/assembly factor-like uncharacterized protein